MRIDPDKYFTRLWEYVADPPTRRVFQELTTLLDKAFKDIKADLESVLLTSSGGVPAGAIIIVTGAACPTGYTERADFADRYVRGTPSGGTVGATGGSYTTQSLSGTTGRNTSSPTSSTADNPHTHTILPPFINVRFCEKT